MSETFQSWKIRGLSSVLWENWYLLEFTTKPREACDEEKQRYPLDTVATRTLLFDEDFFWQATLSVPQIHSS